MTIQLHLTPELESALRERAAAEGKDPTALALEAVAEKLGPAIARSSRDETAERRNAWNRFLEGTREHARSLPAGYMADDSRESIYE